MPGASAYSKRSSWAHPPAGLPAALRVLDVGELHLNARLDLAPYHRLIGVRLKDQHLDRVAVGRHDDERAGEALGDVVPDPVRHPGERCRVVSALAHASGIPFCLRNWRYCATVACVTQSIGWRSALL